MEQKDPVIEQIIERFSKLSTRGRLILYGSRARGDFTDRSDYDLAVANMSELEFNRFLAEMMDPHFTLLKIDVINLDRASAQLLEAVKREGKLLYEIP